VFDTRPDWTLEIADDPWRDPFEGIDTDNPSWDLGRWTKGSVADDEPVAAVIEATLREVVPRFNEMAELVGVDLEFDTITVRVEGYTGDLTVRPVADRSDGGWR
jgi:hypothetical protein